MVSKYETGLFKDTVSSRHLNLCIQCPPLATAWVYAIVQLDLSPAVFSLGVVGVYVWWQGLSLHP